MQVKAKILQRTMRSWSLIGAVFIAIFCFLALVIPEPVLPALHGLIFVSTGLLFGRLLERKQTLLSLAEASPSSTQEIKPELSVACAATQPREADRRAQERDRFLANASNILASSIDYAETLKNLATVAVPEMADWCTVDLLDKESGKLRRLVAAHIDPQRVEAAHAIHERYPPHADDPQGVWHVALTGVPELYPDISDELLQLYAQDEAHLNILRGLGLSSVLIVPITAHGNIFGAMCLVNTESSCRFSDADLQLAMEIGRRAGLAIDNAALYRSLRASEKALRASEAQIRLITNSIPALIAYIDREGRYVFANAMYERWFGHAPEGMIGKTIGEVLGDGFQQKIRPYMDRALIGETVSYELTLSHKLGLRHVSGTYVPDIDADGYVKGFVALVSDVSERKKAEQDMLLKAQVLNSMIEGVSVSDESGFILFTNPAEDQIFGYEPGGLIGKHVSILNAYLPEENQRIVTDVINTLKRRGFWTGEFRNIKKDGTPIVTKARISALELDGKYHWVCVQEDITERKIADDIMRENEEQLRIALDSAGMVAFRLNCETGQMQRTGSSFGGKVLDLEESTLDELLQAMRDEDQENFKVSINRSLRSGSPYSAEFRLKSQDGSERWILGRGQMFTDDEGKARKLVGVAMDVTERKKVEAELASAKETAESANQSKSAFLANMSHEIRTPLGAILGFSELLGSSDQSDLENQESIEVIKRNGRVLLTLIDDILDLSKVEAGRLEIEKIAVPLPRLLEEVRSGLSLSATERGIYLSFQVLGELPEIMQTDPVRLKQILNNIIGNAIKFTEKGGVTVTTQLVAKSPQQNLLYFEVTDTGTGLTEEQTLKLFEPFTQADPSTTRRFGGTGLGLALSRRLAHLLGGDVVLLESEIGRGSTFAISIDPGEHSLKPASLPKTWTGMGQNSNFVREQLRGLKVLIVEDSPDNQKLMSKLLQFSGANVEIAENGQEGLQKALSQAFDIVLMDVQMPIMDGYEATRQLRNHGYDKPIIALTAHAMREERERCMRSGFNDHFSKPVNREALVRGLEKYLVN